MKSELVAEARRRVAASARSNGNGVVPAWIDTMLDPEVLTIGFARRVPTYKRLTLMLRDPERLTKLLTDKKRPVQIVIGGKSHPADDSGKILIQQLVRFSRDPKVRGRIVFLPDYDITLAKTLYPGCDVWLNNPLRPLEACGTSRHEGGAQRRAEPVDPRRLVGRVVRRRERLGDPHRRHRLERRGARRRRGVRALRPHRAPARAEVLRARGRHPARLARGWCGTR